MDNKFVHLHVHTGYSFLDGMCKLEELIPRAKELGMTALAITDHNHLGGVYDFQKQCRAAGIKPILGYEGYYTEDTSILSLSSDERNLLAADKALAAKAITEEEYQVITGKLKSIKLKKSDIKDKIAPYAYDTKQYHIIFLAQNQQGWHNIVRLMSESASKCTFNGRFLCDNGIIKKYSEGVICTTACIANRIARLVNWENNYSAAEKLLTEWSDIFKDRFYLEIQPLAMNEQIKINKFYIAMGEKYGIPLIATSDVHYVFKEDHAMHDVLLCIGTGKKMSDKDRLRYTNDFWLRSAEEMKEAFESQYDYDRNHKQMLDDTYLSFCEKAMAETVKVAERIDENIKIGSDKPLIPQVKLPEGVTAENELRTRCFKALYNLATKDEYVMSNLKTYEKRLKYELDIICPKGFASYLLVVDNYVSWANSNGCVTGPGRGSAAGSLCLYLLGVTKNTDPIKYNMLFERFLTKDRTNMPDIDIDFDYYNRDSVIKYLEDYYGAECVSHIGTFTVSAVKNGLKDVARVLDIPFAEANEISKQLDEIIDLPTPKFRDYDELKNDINPGDLAKWEKFQQLETKYAKVFKLARKFEGLKRNFGVHASGILVMPMAVNDMIPTRVADGVRVSLFTGPEVEELLMIKCDLLGLKTVSAIVKTLEHIGMTIQELYDTVKTDDALMFKMLQDKKSDAVFQLESDLFKGALELIQPTDINDIIAITAAMRPGPLSLQSHIHYARRKNGEEEISYPLRGTEHIFKETYGLALYQEQLMRVGVDCFGFNLNQADTLIRKILAKKKKDKMEMLRRMFIWGKKNTEGPKGWEEDKNAPWYDPYAHYGDEICGGLANGYTVEELEQFNTDIQGYASYLFNLSHSVSYSYISCLTAWLKCYHPVEFMASVISIQSEDKIDKYSQVCEREGIKIIAPDINISERSFTPYSKDKTIYYGLSSIKGVGEAAVDAIIANRPFMSLEDVFEKLPKKVFNKRAAVALAKSGALDSFDINRNRNALLNRIAMIRKDKGYEVLDESLYSQQTCIEYETEVLSAPITYKPWWLNVKENKKIEEIAKIITIKEQVDKNGNLMCFTKLNINNCEVEAVIFASVYCKYLSAFNSDLNPAKLIKVIGKKDDKGKLIVKSATLAK